MSKAELSRRKFLGGTGSLALALPLASLPIAAAQQGNSNPHNLSASRPAVIPYRDLPVRQRGTTVIPVDPPTDGISDCSQAIQNAIDSLPEDGGTVLIRYHNTGHSRDCIYMINTMANQLEDGSKPYYGIKLRSNMLLQFEPGVQLQAMPNNVPRAYIVYVHMAHDVEIANAIIIGERFTHTMSGKGTDEWGYGIALAGSTTLTVRSSHISDCTGDGVSLAQAGTSTLPTVRPNDIVLWNVVSTGNRRQGLSITSGDNIYLLDSEFSYTHGTLPEDGIDIEGSVSNVFIDNCVIVGNQGNGIEINGASGTRTLTNFNITNNVLAGNYSGIYVGARATTTLNTGTVYGNAIYQNRSQGIHFGGPTTSGFTFGGTSACDLKNNSFANNSVTSTQVIYPISATTQKQGYVGGTDMYFSDPALEPGKNNVVGWNFYYSPDTSYTGAQVHPCNGMPFQR